MWHILLSIKLFPLPNLCIKALSDGIWRWDLWGMIGVRRDHDGGAPMMESVPL